MENISPELTQKRINGVVIKFGSSFVWSLNSICLALYMLYMPLRTLTEVFLGKTISQALCLAIFIIPTIVCLFFQQTLGDKRILYLIATLILALGATVIIFPHNIKYITEYMMTSLYAIFPLVLINEISYVDDFEEGFYYGNVLLFIFWQIVVVTGNLELEAGGEYSMSFGMSIILPTLYFMYMLFETNKKIWGILAIICTFEIFVWANKSVLVVVIVYYVVLTFGDVEKDRTKKIRNLVIMFALVIALILSYKPMIRLLLDHGITSRTLKHIYSGQFISYSIYGESSSRFDIYNNSIKLIKDRLLTGYGIRGDMANLGYYPHNFILELSVDFGIPVSVICLLIFFRGFIRYIKNDGSLKDIAVMLFVLSVSVLSVSNSIWNMYQLWLLIAILLKNRIYRKEI